MDTKTVYKSKIDWWVWAVLGFWFSTIFAVSIGSPWWLTLIFGLLPSILIIVLIIGCWYEIDGDTLIIYQFFMPHRIPISKIKEVKKTVGYLATAGMSAQRVSIKLSDRRVLKSSMPLVISPNHRDAFIAHLHSINPNITYVPS
ncbi:MAG: PH domain-containing protein [Muribaculaceae bacterium]|nr:PH domain-containing protein [Muribaculaceae bacterium]